MQYFLTSQKINFAIVYIIAIVIAIVYIIAITIAIVYITAITIAIELLQYIARYCNINSIA